jgi:hypothetical protein
MEMIIGAILLIILLILVAKRIDDKGKETFEKRDH